MVFARRIPAPPLAEFVDWLWFYADWNPSHEREHVLPDGTFELVINLKDESRKLFDRRDRARFRGFQNSWLSGAQSEYLIIDSLPKSSMIGAHFKPGGIAPFLQASAEELRDQVFELGSIWGSCATEWRERLMAAVGPEAKFKLLEEFLLELMARNMKYYEQRMRVREAIRRLLQPSWAPDLRSLARDLGCSHKHFIAEFRREVGLTPKLFWRIRRFQEVLARIGKQHEVEWADVSFTCGYYDQAHFINDFKNFAGLNPTTYLSHRMEYPGFARALD